MTCTAFASSGVNPSDTRTCGATSVGALQFVQTRRMRRWAAMRTTDVATRYGSIPMFMRRLIVEGASFVWSVESTRWPVSAALTAISAVSKSRISPTRMMFGSCRRNERSAAAKFRPIWSFIWTWLMPGRLNSTGSSAVMMFVSGVLIRESAE